MSRYTVVVIESGDEVRHKWSLVEERIKRFTEPLGYHFTLKPSLIIILSNGLSRDSHVELYEGLRATGLQVKVASTIHKTPMMALLKALKALSSVDLFYEEGVEEEYYVAYIAFRYFNPEYVVEEFKRRRDVLGKVLDALIYTGSIPLSLNLDGVVAVLSTRGLTLIERLKSENLYVRVARGIHGRETVESAIHG